MAEYSSPGTLGPTADYPGDSSDYSGGSSFNWNGFADSIVSIIPGILSGTSQIIGATRGNPTVSYVNGQPQYQYPQQQQQQQNNTALYIGGAVIALLVVIAIIYFISKK